LTSSTQKIALTPTDQSQIKSQLNNTLTTLLNHISTFFTSPAPRDLPSHLLSPNPQSAHSPPSTPVTETPQFPVLGEDSQEWSFLPRYSSGLACVKWGLAILEALAKRVGEFVSWGEEMGDAVRIAIGGIRERIIKAALVAWRDGSDALFWEFPDGRYGAFLCA
jgi:hypothetical protein